MNLVHYGDMAAIPFFLLAFVYFYRLKNRNMTETVLLVFSLVGFIADLYFTIKFMEK